MQKTKPILFTGENVRAILDGRKTQTRRVVKGMALEWLGEHGFTPEFVANPDNFLCPYGVVGDRLWVRETFGIFDVDADEDIAIAYKADNSDAEWFKNKRQDFNELRIGKWRSPFHLHKWAARLWLEITGIRVERVQDIKRGDVLAEGVDQIHIDKYLKFNFHRDDAHGLAFKELWDSINAKRGYGWDKNVWVWVVEFREVQDAEN